MLQQSRIDPDQLVVYVCLLAGLVSMLVDMMR